MPIIIHGKTYNLPGDAGERNITMGEQNLIERQFKKPFEKIVAPLNVSEKAKKSLSETKQDELEVAGREVFLIMVWIARRRAGEDLTFDEAANVSIDEIEIVENDVDPLEDQDKVLEKES